MSSKGLLFVVSAPSGTGAPVKMRAAVLEQVQRIVWSLFGVTEGRVTFSLGEERADEIYKLRIPTPRAVLHGFADRIEGEAGLVDCAQAVGDDDHDGRRQWRRRRGDFHERGRRDVDHGGRWGRARGDVRRPDGGRGIRDPGRPRRTPLEPPHGHGVGGAHGDGGHGEDHGATRGPHQRKEPR